MKMYPNIRMMQFFAVLLFFGRNVGSSNHSYCGKTVSETYLDVASDLINKAKLNIPACPGFGIRNKPIDCADVLYHGHTKSGVYTIWPVSRVIEDKSVNVYCDMDTDGGGWTVIQRRGNFGRAEDYFFKDWKHYKDGFGDIKEDFWLGNDNIFALTNQRIYSARFDLRDVALDTRYALYDYFWIDDENNSYTLHITGYRGNAGDSMAYHNGLKFSTKDRDNDKKDCCNCAQDDKGGWWYDACHNANLNGLYRRGKHAESWRWVSWHLWKGFAEGLDSTEIKIRPKNHHGFDAISATPKI